MRLVPDDPFMHMDAMEIFATPPPPPNYSIIYSDPPDAARRQIEVDPTVSGPVPAASTPVVPKIPTPNHRRRANKRSKRLSPLSAAAQDASDNLLRLLQNRRSVHHSGTEDDDNENSDK